MDSFGRGYQYSDSHTFDRSRQAMHNTDQPKSMPYHDEQIAYGLDMDGQRQSSYSRMTHGGDVLDEDFLGPHQPDPQAAPGDSIDDVPNFLEPFRANEVPIPHIFVQQSQQHGHLIDQPIWSEVSVSAPAAIHTPCSIPDSGYATLQQRTRRRPARNYNVSQCKVCGRSSKNRSEAAKHAQTHQKLCKCDQPHCQRGREGFATRNDLDRHRKAVHGLTPQLGNTSGYICSECPCASGTPKWWPRKDNFVSHIKRKHLKSDNTARVAEILQRSEHEHRPQHAHDEVTDGASVLESAPPASLPLDVPEFPQDLSMAPTSPLSLHPYQDEANDAFTLGLQPNIDGLEGISATLDADTSYAGKTESGFPLAHGSSGRRVSAFDVGPASHRPRSTNPTMTSMPVKAEQLMPNFAFPQQGLGEPSGSSSHMLWDTDAAPKEEPTSPDRSRVAPADRAAGNFECVDCGKIKRRLCDLKKHRKRHSRPYGCTFPGCARRFGSRNDWKRHENAQHRQNDMWRCNHPHATWPPPYKCGYIAWDGETFQRHLARAHGVVDEIHRDAMADSMHIGQYAHNRFWCGFCNDLLLPDGSAPHGWLCRQAHIGDHFDAGADCDEWVDIEQNKPKRSITNEDRARARRRMQTGVGEYEGDAFTGIEIRPHDSGAIS